MVALLILSMIVACPTSGGEGDDDDATAVDPEWFDGPTLLAPLQENAVVVLQGEVVILGGFDDTLVSVARVEAYTPGGGWRSLPDLPEAMHHANAAVVDDVLYVMGGNLGFQFTPTAASWALIDDAWQERAPMPAARARGSASVGVIGGKIYLAGGLTGGAVDQVDVYDPVADTWTALAPMPEPRDHGGGCVLDGRLHHLVGRQASLSTNAADHFVYDPETDEWDVAEPAPTARGGVATEAFEGACWVVGGEGHPDAPGGIYADVETFGDGWQPLDPLVDPVHGTGLAALDGRLYLPGGAERDGFGPVDRLRVFGVPFE
jgi:N-acetylneuraminic acid mutarotase